MRIIIQSRLYQEDPFKDEFDLIEAKIKGVNGQVKFKIYFREPVKYEVEVLIMQEQMSFAAKF